MLPEVSSSAEEVCDTKAVNEEIGDDYTDDEAIAVDQVVNDAHKEGADEGKSVLSAEQVDVESQAQVTTAYPLYGQAVASYPVFGEALSYPVFAGRSLDNATDDQLETKQDSLSQLHNLTSRVNILAGLVLPVFENKLY